MVYEHLHAAANTPISYAKPQHSVNIYLQEAVSLPVSATVYLGITRTALLKATPKNFTWELKRYPERRANRFILTVRSQDIKNPNEPHNQEALRQLIGEFYSAVDQASPGVKTFTLNILVTVKHDQSQLHQFENWKTKNTLFLSDRGQHDDAVLSRLNAGLLKLSTIGSPFINKTRPCQYGQINDYLTHRTHPQNGSRPD